MPTDDASLFDLPAPLARVNLRNPNNSDIVSDLLMLLDSGADVTLIPIEPCDPAAGWPKLNLE